MKFSDFIKVTAIKAEMAADEKPEAIRELVRQPLATAGAIAAPDVEGIVTAIMNARESWQHRHWPRSCRATHQAP